MMTVLRDRTHVRGRDNLLLAELNSAKNWVANELYLLSEDLVVTFETEVTPGAVQDYDLGAAVTAAVPGAEVWGLKALWVKYAGETKFTEVCFKDANDPEFRGRDQMDPQPIHPLFADVVNFNKLRFAPSLPASTTLRVDWIGNPPDLTLESGPVTSIPVPAHPAMVDLATAKVFNDLDDTRSTGLEVQAERALKMALHVIKRRQSLTRTRTKPFSRRYAMR